MFVITKKPGESVILTGPDGSVSKLKIISATPYRIRLGIEGDIKASRERGLSDERIRANNDR